MNSRALGLLMGPLSKLMARWMATPGVHEQFEAILGHNPLDRLHMIQAPTLVITGTDERLINSGSSDVLANAIPNARYVGIEGGSHSCFVSQRGRFNREVLDFLAGN